MLPILCVEVVYKIPRPHQTLLLAAERNEQKCVLPRAVLQRLKQARQQRRSAPVIHHALGPSVRIVMRAHENG
jgi:hypothetical protein